MIRSDDTDSPLDDTLYENNFAFGATPLRLPSAAIIPATSVP
jgi:hypothetical protein